VVDAAFDAGINFFDTADIYGGTRSEVMLGQALGGRRDEIVLATKFAIPTGKRPDQKGGSRRYVMSAVEASLKRLGTDYIDLYQMHMPDAETPIEETLRALDDLITSGKVRYIGNSNFSGWRIADADWVARSEHLNRFVSAQNNYSLLERQVEQEVIPACERFGLGLLPYFPLASGLLTGKYRRGEEFPEGTRLASAPYFRSVATDENFAYVEKLTAWAEQRGHSILELAVAWLAAQEGVGTVITGATKPEQITANAAGGAWRLTPEELGDLPQP
jgi:aryl-alcohol dehydrogenase-like predicted oxidoreductase